MARSTLKEPTEKIMRFHRILTDASTVTLEEDETTYKLVVHVLLDCIECFVATSHSPEYTESG